MIFDKTKSEKFWSLQCDEGNKNEGDTARRIWADRDQGRAPDKARDCWHRDTPGEVPVGCSHGLLQILTSVQRDLVKVPKQFSPVIICI